MLSESLGLLVFKKYRWIVIGILLIFYCFAFQGNRGLFDPDEGRYSAVALQMIKSGDWLIPRTHPDHEHFTKPPLTYWSIAHSIQVFGKTEFAIRFTNALSFFLCIIISFFLGKVFVPKRPWLISLIFGTFLFPATMCNGATTDYLVTMFETLAVCFFSHAYWRSEGNKQLILVYLMWISFGLAFLTKGPPALLPLFSIFLFFRFKCSRNSFFKIRWISGLLIVLVIGCSWFLVVVIQRPELAKYFLWDEVVLRVFTSHHQRHSTWYAGFYIFLPVLVGGTLPWSYFAGKGFIYSLKMSRNSVQKKSIMDVTQSLFLILWFALPLSIFMISKSKLPLYVLPLFVPLAIMAGKNMERVKFSFPKFKYAIAFWCVLIVLSRVGMAKVPFKKDSSKFAQKIVTQYPYPIGEILFVNSRPALGLQFYTGADIGRVSLESLDLEKKFKEKKPHLWLVKPEDLRPFYQRAGLHNVVMRLIAPIEAQKKYVLLTELVSSKLKKQ